MFVNLRQRCLMGWLFVLLLASGCGRTHAGKSISVAYGNAPPMIAINGEGKPAGFAVAMVEEAARREGITLVWSAGGTRTQNDQRLAQGTLDLILTGYPTPE